MRSTVVVAEDEPITRMDICEMLISAGYDVIGEASDGLAAVELCRKYRPELVLMDIKMPQLDGIKATKLIVKENLVDSVVMLTAYSGREFIDQVKEAGAIGYIIKPVDEKNLLPEIEIAIHKGKELNRIKRDILKVKEDAEKAKTIARAKELIMEKYKISEDDAYKRIRKLSMDNRCQIIDIAKEIVEYLKFL